MHIHPTITHASLGLFIEQRERAQAAKGFFICVTLRIKGEASPPWHQLLNCTEIHGNRRGIKAPELHTRGGIEKEEEQRGMGNQKKTAVRREGQASQV